MKEVLEAYEALRVKTIELSEKSAKLLDISTLEEPSSFFNMANSKCVLAIETLDNYYNIWGNLKFTTQSDKEKESILLENGERVTSISRMIFIEIFSSLEYCIKKAFLYGEFSFSDNDRLPFVRPSNPNRLYLSRIMEISEKNNLITSDDYVLWTALNQLRNSIVHNNVVQEKNVSYEFPNVTLNLHKGEMLRGNLLLLPKLTDWMIDNAYTWIEKSKK